jgi:hypothetical protein
MDCLPREEKTAIDHESNSALESVRYTMECQRTVSSALTDCLSRGAHPKLAPTGEAPGVAFGLLLLDGPLEFDAGEQLQQLAENAAYSIHG